MKIKMIMKGLFLQNMIYLGKIVNTINTGPVPGCWRGLRGQAGLDQGWSWHMTGPRLVTIVEAGHQAQP